VYLRGDAVRVGFIGAGHIARALAEGWSRTGLVDAPVLSFFDVVPARSAELAAMCGGETASTTVDLVLSADVVVVAVRPQDVEDVLNNIGSALGGRLLVSVAAGVTMARLRAALPAGCHVARVMPNGAAAVGLGVFLFVAGTLSVDEQEDVATLLALAGTVVMLDEEMFDVATAVAGCMPGLLASLVSHFAAAAQLQGVPASDARAIAIEGVHGAAALIAREGDLEAVMAATATSGGMTAAGIAALEAAGAAAAVNAAVAAAAQRAKELA
jgi:pyrroline-5-carboxylate reductase